MSKDNILPTTPGVYWWREKDGDEWEIGEIYRGGDGGLYWQTMYVSGKPLQIFGGQWSKAHKPDEGIEAWAVFNQVTGEMLVSWLDKDTTQEMCDNMNRMSQKYRYTCQPVTIYKREVEI